MDAFKDSEEEDCGIKYDLKEIFLLAAFIGGITFVLSLLGTIVGNRFGSRYKRKAELAGGIILILIGVKILFEHLGILNL